MLPSLSRVWRPVVHDSLPRVTRSGLSPAVTKWFDLIQGTHKSVLEAFTKDALVTDGGQTYRERTAIQGWLTGRRVHHTSPWLSAEQSDANSPPRRPGVSGLTFSSQVRALGWRANELGLIERGGWWTPLTERRRQVEAAALIRGS
jgi:hypothetical protein